MMRSLLLSGMLATAVAGVAAAQASVHVEQPHLDGPRELAEETANSVVAHYVESWQSLGSALSQNKASLIDRDFTGDARSKLSDTIDEQMKAGIASNYKDQSHDIQIVFYSPEGSSIELRDDVVYDEQILQGGKLLTTQPVKTRYIVVLTPSETRWRVRVFQAVPAT